MSNNYVDALEDGEGLKIVVHQEGTAPSTINGM